MFGDYLQKDAGRAFGPPTALFPISQSCQADAQQRRKKEKRRQTTAAC